MRRTWALFRGRVIGTVRRGGEEWPPVLDGPAVRRLVLALETGVEGPELEERFGRDADELRRIAREFGWDGTSRDLPPTGPTAAAHVPCGWEQGPRRVSDDDE